MSLSLTFAVPVADLVREPFFVAYGGNNVDFNHLFYDGIDPTDTKFIGCGWLHDAIINSTQTVVVAHLIGCGFSGPILDFIAKAVEVQLTWIMYGRVDFPIDRESSEFSAFCKSVDRQGIAVQAFRDVVANYSIPGDKMKQQGYFCGPTSIYETICVVAVTHDLQDFGPEKIFAAIYFNGQITFAIKAGDFATKLSELAEVIRVITYYRATNLRDDDFMNWMKYFRILAALQHA